MEDGESADSMIMLGEGLSKLTRLHWSSLSQLCLQSGRNEHGERRMSFRPERWDIDEMSLTIIRIEIKIPTYLLVEASVADTAHFGSLVVLGKKIIYGNHQYGITNHGDVVGSLECTVFQWLQNAACEGGIHFVSEVYWDLGAQDELMLKTTVIIAYVNQMGV